MSSRILTVPNQLTFLRLGFLPFFIISIHYRRYDYALAVLIIAALTDALVLSPSSFGLQPWKFFVIDDPAVRAKLKEASWGQTQIVDADKLVAQNDVQKLRVQRGNGPLSRHNPECTD